MTMNPNTCGVSRCRPTNSVGIMPLTGHDSTGRIMVFSTPLSQMGTLRHGRRVGAATCPQSPAAGSPRPAERLYRGHPRMLLPSHWTPPQPRVEGGSLAFWAPPSPISEDAVGGVCPVPPVPPVRASSQQVLTKG